MSEIGHNAPTDQIKSIIERIETMDGQIKDLTDDRNGIYTEAKGNGYDVKALRTIVRMRKQNPADRAEQEAILETYMHALNMV